MRVEELLTLVTQGTFLLIALLTSVDFLRHRDRTRLDIALMFGALAALIVIQRIPAIIGVQVAWLSTAGAILLLSQPYLLLRLVQHFRHVPRIVELVAVGGMVASWAILLALPTPLPPLLTQLVVGYFL